MIKSPEVSIIVPVYNVKKYLPKCVSSLLKQNYKDYFIILVDDGSTDGSGNLCDSFAKLHKNIKVLHKSNGGLSDARNFGVTHVKSPYIIFVDSDDYVDTNFVSYLLSLEDKYKSDVAVTGYYSESLDGIISRKCSAKKECVLTPQEGFKEMCYGENLPIMAWAKVYKRGLLLKYPYPIGVLNEDVATTYKILLDSNKIAVGNKVFYHYIDRPTSILHMDNKEKFFNGVIAAKRIIDVSKDKLKSKYLIKAAYGRLTIESLGLLHRTINHKEVYIKACKLIEKAFNGNYIISILDKNLSLSRRIQIGLFSLNKYLYRYFYLFIKRRR